MTLEADYERAARELLVEHLIAKGLRPRLTDRGVATGIGGITIDFRIESIEPRGDAMQMVFWALIDGVSKLVPSRIDLDLLGLGADAHQALTEGVHVLLDTVIPVLEADHDRRSAPSGVTTMQMTSMTDGVATEWDLITGAASIGGDRRDLIVAAVDDLALAQGIVDSITGALAEPRPHWFKLFLVRAEDGRLIGDMKIDGVAVGITESFESPQWPTGSMVVRQFGLVRPAGRNPDPAQIEFLKPADAAPSTPRRWWQRTSHFRRYEPLATGLPALAVSSGSRASPRSAKDDEGGLTRRAARLVPIGGHSDAGEQQPRQRFA
jgi:hypothetical protein